MDGESSLNENVRHTPVLLAESLAGLNVRPGGIYLDLTVGLGGHAAAIAEAVGPTGRVEGLDQDPAALALASERLKPWADRVRLTAGNFERFDENLGLQPASVDGILADLGVSSLQLDEAARGFGFSREGPLDMRMGSTGETALEYLRRVSPEELEAALRDAGEERFARKLAARLKEHAPEWATTKDLADAVCRWIPRRGRSHPATRVFLGLRMAVNREMPRLRSMLERAPEVLRPGGRLAVITFHSTEDRVVKRYGKEEWREGPLRAVNKKVLIASREEQRVNPRSRSAKLRVFEKI